MWLFFLPKTPLFTLQTLSWLSLHSHTTTLFPSFSGDFMGGKANTSVMSGVVFGKHLMMGVWMVLMNHNEPLHNHNTHHVCLPAFHTLCFPFTSTPHKWCSCDGLSNGVHSHSTNVMCHPPLSPSQSHPHSCLSSQQTHTMWEVSSQQMPNTQKQPR